MNAECRAPNSELKRLRIITEGTRFEDLHREATELPVFMAVSPKAEPRWNSAGYAVHGNVHPLDAEFVICHL